MMCSAAVQVVLCKAGIGGCTLVVCGCLLCTLLKCKNLASLLVDLLLPGLLLLYDTLLTSLEQFTALWSLCTAGHKPL